MHFLYLYVFRSFKCIVRLQSILFNQIAMLQYCRVWWIHCSSDIDKFTVILPEMLVAEGVTMLNQIYSGNNVLIEDTDCNNNSLDGSLDDIPDSSDIGGISLTSAPIPASTGQDDETLDKQLAHNHANVDKLFSGSSSLGGGGDRHRPF